MYDMDVYKTKSNEQINKEELESIQLPLLYNKAKVTNKDEEIVELRRQCNELIKSNKKLAMMLIKKNFKN